MVTAVETQPGTNPDRASFTTALEAAREQVTAAQGVCLTGLADLPGVIGRAVLSTLLPARRLRYSARIVKRAISKYQARGPNIDRTSYKATLSINILAPPQALTTPASA